MRIAIISEVFLPKVDGVVNRTLNLIRELPRLGDELLTVCPRAPGCRDCPVPVVDVPSFSFVLYPEYRIGLPGSDLAEAIARFAPDVIHYVNPFAFGFRCHDRLGEAGLRTPSVFSFHTLYGEFVKDYKLLKPLSALRWWLMRHYHNRADANLTVSSIMQEDLARRGFRRVELWPPAVNTVLFHPSSRSDAMRARMSNGRPERPLLLTVSRLAPEKNVGFLADVLRELPGAQLAVVGDGPHRAALERRFEGLDAHFIGYLKGKDLASAYASADAFVYASETETMGNVVLEAMACGCPVIVPRAGGIPSLLSHGAAGFLYSPRDVPDAVACTRALLEDQSLRERVGRDARQAMEGRGWDQSVGKVREAYVRAIDEYRRAPAPATWSDSVARGTMSALVTAFRVMSWAADALGSSASQSGPTEVGAGAIQSRSPSSAA
jgi:glycosyltransferase involved in cell wall biosynthesis